MFDRVLLRDSTLREGLDTPNVNFSVEDRVRIATALARAGVAEAEVVAPSRVLQEVALARRLREETGIRTSGLIYAASQHSREEIEQASAHLDRFDLLMPLSPRRAPSDLETKKSLLIDVLELARSFGSDVGVGFPHATQADTRFLAEIAREATRHGAARVTIYDTNGSADPFRVRSLIEALRTQIQIPVFFHGHDDLGLATANALAAVLAGATGLDVTVNGLGDRAGNACLEQVVMTLHLRNRDCGVSPSTLLDLSHLVEELSGVAVSKLAPVVGQFVFAHRSPAHLSIPGEFEPFDPGIVGRMRHIDGVPQP